ncbi:MAG: YfhO family protein, partial [Solobacterium sp.]|nr:YfhO family protein [Solobacterium sp.]
MAKKKYYLCYSVFFILFWAVCYGLYFVRYHKALIWSLDGLEQQYVNFVYTGQWVRNLFTGRFEVWDPSIGYGSDVFIVLGNTLLDPFNWLGAVVPAHLSEYAFDVFVVVKMYCAGLAFSAFCRYMKQDGYPALAGTLA